MGISTSGAALNNGLSEDGADPFYPDYYNLVIDIDKSTGKSDTCIIHQTLSGQFHYHHLPQCLSAGLSDLGINPIGCDEDNDCHLDRIDFSLRGFGTQPNLNPIGIAKDGHVIYGPYKEDGTIWNHCDLDICNGIWLGDDIYAYAATTFHPYFVGCWGPGNYLNGIT